ncbi:hypothetical protein V3331_01925 [Gaopeijia maritima]|uniref:hypothetical protein n=1 Tax=Gaopeijia maritima TaxID=3119007 RepID=UPI003254B060
MTFRTNYRKMRKIAGGWAAAVGEALVINAALNALASAPREAEPKAVVEVGIKEMLEKIADPGIATVGRNRVGLVRDDGATFSLRRLEVQGLEALELPQLGYSIFNPPGLPPDVVAETKDVLKRELDRPIRNQGDLGRLALWIGWIFHRVHEANHTVGPFVEMAFLVRTRAGVVDREFRGRSSELAAKL